jgi:hypothetical protein
MTKIHQMTRKAQIENIRLHSHLVESISNPPINRVFASRDGGSRSAGWRTRSSSPPSTIPLRPSFGALSRSLPHPKCKISKQISAGGYDRGHRPLYGLLLSPPYSSLALSLTLFLSLSPPLPPTFSLLPSLSLPFSLSLSHLCLSSSPAAPLPSLQMPPPPPSQLHEC